MLTIKFLQVVINLKPKEINVGGKIIKVEKVDYILLDRISKGEGTDKGFGYNAIYGGKLYRKLLPKPLTSMTLAEVSAFQDVLADKTKKSKYPSTAVGKYQFVKKTLDYLKKKLKIDDNVIFTPDLQDALIIYKLNIERKYKEWKNEGIDNISFMELLSFEFASIEDPKNPGTTKYGQPIGTTIKDLSATLRVMRDGDNNTSDIPYKDNTPQAKSNFEKEQYKQLDKTNARKAIAKVDGSGAYLHNKGTRIRYSTLGPEARRFYDEFSRHMLARGIKIQIPWMGGNRSLADQELLYAKGRTKPGKKITWTLNSKHRGGRAIDIISSKGYKDPGENAIIAQSMRAYAKSYPELGAGFLINKD